jgi:NAD(P)-dependent dehydrogenase (short-subunit alcohol dehydrogenase family)
MTATLDGSIALVTGASAGIGRAVAQQLAELGAEVIVHGRNAERGAAAVKEIAAAGGSARFVAADLGDADQVRGLAEEVGPVDILINNAGVYRFGPTTDTDDASFDDHVNTNLRAPYILMQKLAPGMAERGRGAVVNVSTVAASAPVRGAGIYGASKAALELLTRVWADEFGAAGIRVNAVAAGPTRTLGTADFGEYLQGLGAGTTLRRVAEAEEVASAITFLATPAASYVNGTVLGVTGGTLAITA